jgi:hypothetical protein
MHLGHARRWATTLVHPGEEQAPAALDDMVVIAFYGGKEVSDAYEYTSTWYLYKYCMLLYDTGQFPRGLRFEV